MTRRTKREDWEPCQESEYDDREVADVAPLDPLRYDPRLFPDVIAPPYDVIDPALRKELGARHPNNVVHLDLPEGEGDQRYENARVLFARWQETGVLVRDGAPAFWRYAQTFEPPGGGARVTRKGFFALVRATPYSEGSVLPHERTLTGPKVDREKLALATRATLSPQFLLYSDPVRALDAPLDSGQPFADFESDDGIRHEIWRVTDRRAIEAVRSTLRDARLLIADGHHRYETSVALAARLDSEAPAGCERGSHRFTPVLLSNGDDPNLLVFPTHRLVHSLPNVDFDSFIARVSDLYEAKPAGLEDLRDAPDRALLALAPGGRSVLLVVREGVDLASHPVLSKRPPIVRETAIALLHDGILESVLGISPAAQAAKTNITYVQDVRDGIGALERGDGQLFFICKPTPVAVIRRVAEAGLVMPQKSTFFHPKVPTGLLFHTLDPARSVD